eukprot:145573-Chlamydomonas_euryale.AAC.2
MGGHQRVWMVWGRLRSTRHLCAVDGAALGWCGEVGSDTKGVDIVCVQEVGSDTKGVDIVCVQEVGSDTKGEFHWAPAAQYAVTNKRKGRAYPWTQQGALPLRQAATCRSASLATSAPLPPMHARLRTLSRPAAACRSASRATSAPLLSLPSNIARMSFGAATSVSARHCASRRECWTTALDRQRPTAPMVNGEPLTRAWELCMWRKGKRGGVNTEAGTGSLRSRQWWRESCHLSPITCCKSLLLSHRRARCCNAWTDERTD